MNSTRQRLLLAGILFLFTPLLMQGQWQSIPLPVGGDMWSVTQSADTILAVEARMHFWRSEDAGQSWQQFAPPPGWHYGRSTALYAANGRMWMRDDYMDTLYVYGRSSGWTPVTDAPAPRPGVVHDIMVTGDSVMYGTRDGLFLSTDSTGLSWSPISFGFVSGEVTVVRTLQTPTESGLLCAVDGRGIYKKLAGAAWSSVSHDEHVKHLCDLIHTGQSLIAVEAYSGNVFVSSTGLQWDTLSLAGDPFVLRVHRVGGTLFLTSDKGLFLSTDNGQSWSQEELMSGGIMVTDLDAHAGRIVVTTIPGGVFLSTDAGATWTQSGFRDVQPGSIIEHKGGIILTHAVSDACHWLVQNQWQWLPMPKAAEVMWQSPSRLFSYHDNLYWAKSLPSDGYSELWRSEDDAVSWQRYDTLTARYLRPMFAEGDGWLFVNSNTDLLRSSDDGDHWQGRTVPNCSPLFIGAGTGHLYVSDGCQLRHSTDAGDSWDADTLGLPGMTMVTLVVTDSLVCVTYGGDMVYVRLHGDTQFRLSTAAVTGYVIQIDQMYAIGGTIFVRTLGGNVFRRDPVTALWELWETGFTASSVGALSGITGQALYANDPSGGLWSRSLSKVTTVPPLASTSALHIDAWPQPATDAVHVRVTGGEGPVDATVTDLLGRRWLRQSSEREHFTLPIEHLPAGMYLLQVHRGGHLHTVRLVK